MCKILMGAAFSLALGIGAQVHANVLNDNQLDKVNAGDFITITEGAFPITFTAFATGDVTSVFGNITQLPSGQWQVTGSAHSCSGTGC